MNYYQGMNYIAVYLLRELKDPQFAYQVFCYVAENHLQDKFDTKFKGLTELVFMTDKVIQRYCPKIWALYQKVQMSSVHFCVSPLLTIFSCYCKNEQNFDKIAQLWDLFMVDGYKEALKAMAYIITLQSSTILSLDPDIVMATHQKMDGDFFKVSEKAGAAEPEMKRLWDCFNKKNITEFELSSQDYDKFLSHYNMVHRAILTFWSDE